MARSLPNPVIVVPGITATYLRDDYPLPPKTVWSVITKQYERVALHPDNPKYEVGQPARVGPDQIFEIAYEELVKELRHNLMRRHDAPIPVYPFGYDWRQPLEAAETELARFIDEVIERTKLLRHYHKDGYAENPRVNLVGHSMGGLVIAGCLEKLGSKSRVEKVATLATPFGGSFEAVLKVTTGTAALAGTEPSSREREAARLTPALYYLMPSFNVVDEAGRPQSLFQAETWQRSVVATLAQFVSSRGVHPAGAKAQAQELFERLLKDAGGHRRRIGRFKLEQAGLTARDWLCVAGVNARTRVRLTIRSGRGGPEFDLSSSDRVNDWQMGDGKKDLPNTGRMTGDGTVPYGAAAPPFLEENNLVCVAPQDYGYWEIADRLLTEVAGFHGILPNMDMLHRLIVRHFTGAGDKHGNTWGRCAPGVERGEWEPAVAGLEAKF